MDLQKHSRVLNETIEELSDESSYKKLFHDYRDDEVLPSGKVLKEIVDLCHAVLFPGYYGHTKINKQTVKFHTGVYVNTLHTLLSKQIYSGLSFFGIDGGETSILNQSQELSSKFILSLPSIRAILATDAEAAYDGDPAATDLNEIIFCYPGFRAICNYRIAHKLFELGVPYIPRMITEMAHSDTGIDIHPGAKIGHSFSIDHGTGTVIGETSVIGNHVRLFQGVSLSGEQLSDCCSQDIRGSQRHPILEDRVTIYSNSTLIGRIRIGEGAVICGNVWVTEDVPAGAIVSQKGINKNV